MIFPFPSYQIVLQVNCKWEDVFRTHVLGDCFLICVGLTDQASFILLIVSLQSSRFGYEVVHIFNIHLRITISLGLSCLRGDAGTLVYTLTHVITLYLNSLGCKISWQMCWTGESRAADASLFWQPLCLYNALRGGHCCINTSALPYWRLLLSNHSFSVSCTRVY